MCGGGYGGSLEVLGRTEFESQNSELRTQNSELGNTGAAQNSEMPEKRRVTCEGQRVNGSFESVKRDHMSQIAPWFVESSGISVFLSSEFSVLSSQS